MKTFLLSLFTILLAFSSKLTSATAYPTIEIDGKTVRDNGTFVFYMLPVIRGRSPGQTDILRIRRETCPTVIAQDPSELSFAMPIEIPTPKRISVLSTMLDYRLEYLYYPWSCSSKPASWTVVEELAEGFFFKIGRFEKRADGFFKLKTYDADHRFDKLVFCDRYGITCGDVGVYGDISRNIFLIAMF